MEIQQYYNNIKKKYLHTHTHTHSEKIMQVMGLRPSLAYIRTRDGSSET